MEKLARNSQRPSNCRSIADGILDGTHQRKAGEKAGQLIRQTDAERAGGQ
jgi:hypothetical protein